MAHESTNTRSTTNGSEHDALSVQLLELRKDVTELTRSLASAIGNGGNSLANDVTDGVTEAARYMGRKGRAADVRIENAVAANPYMALAIAAVAGLLLGAMSRR